MDKKDKKRKSQADIDRQKKRNALKNMYFNRYLMVRYFLAILLFSNFYWALYTWGSWIFVIPAVMLILAVTPCFENIRSYGETAANMKGTKRYYKAQLAVNACLIVLCFTPMFKETMPFLNDTLNSRILACTIFLIGFILSNASYQRLKKIDINNDKQYFRIKQYEKAINLHL